MSQTFYREVVADILQINQSLTAFIEPIVERQHLNLVQASVLNVIHENENTTISTICNKLHANQGNTSTLCKKLEKDGYVIRQRSRSDERVVNILLTDSGLKAIEAIKKDVNDLVLPKVKGLSNEDRQQIRNVLTKINTITNELSR